MAKIGLILAENLKSWREQRGMTQGDLAKKAGMSIQVVHKIENQKSWPGLDTINQLSAALEIDEGLLFAAAFKRPEVTPEEALEALTRFVQVTRAQSKIPVPHNETMQQGLAAYEAGKKSAIMKRKSAK